jgi:rare lipoprotein A
MLLLSGFARANVCDIAGEIPDNAITASWYGHEHRGKPTASGLRFDERELTAAHASLPLLALVEVTNLFNGRKIRVRITDRGLKDDGQIDLSEAAANALGMRACGLALVVLAVVAPGS